jgi:hypothetical protein
MGANDPRFLDRNAAHVHCFVPAAPTRRATPLPSHPPTRRPPTTCTRGLTSQHLGRCTRSGRGPHALSAAISGRARSPDDSLKRSKATLRRHQRHNHRTSQTSQTATHAHSAHHDATHTTNTTLRPPPLTAASLAGLFLLCNKERYAMSPKLTSNRRYD